MRGIYDGPTTGRHSLFSSIKKSRAKSLDIPRKPLDPEIEVTAFGSPPALPQDSLHEQLRRATQTPPRNIPGSYHPDGTPKQLKPLAANVGLLLHVLDRHTPRPSPRPTAPPSPTSSVASGLSSVQAENKLLSGPPSRQESQNLDEMEEPHF